MAEHHDSIHLASSTGVSTAMRRETRIGNSPIVAFFTDYIPFFPVLKSFESPQARNLVWLGMFIYMMQHLGFILNRHFSDVWENFFGAAVLRTFYAFSIPLYDSTFLSGGGEATLHTLMWTLTALGFVIVGILVYYHIAHGDTDKQNELFVYFNRALLQSMSTWLLIPSVQLVAASLYCGDDNIVGSLDCWSGSHIAFIIGSVLYVLFTLPLMYLALTCQFFSFSTSDHSKARAHSLVDDFTFFHDVSSAVLLPVLVGMGQKQLFAIVHATTALITAVMFAYHMPYYRRAVNSFFAATHFAEFVLGILAAIACSSKTIADSNAAPMIFIGLVPLIWLCGQTAVQCRVSQRFLHRLHVVELGVRLPDEEEVEFCKGLVNDAIFSRFKDIEMSVIDATSKGDTGSVVSSAQSMRRQPLPGIVEPYIDSVHLTPDVQLATRFLNVYRETLHQPCNMGMLAFAARIFTKGVMRWPRNAFLRMSFCAFIGEYLPQLGGLGLGNIEEISMMNASVVTRYRVFELANVLRSALGIKNQTHLLHSNAARSMHCDVLSHMHNFWLKLTEPSVNIGQVSAIADEITVARQAALVQFRRALQHQTTSDPNLILRMGDFLQDVMLDSEAAQECYSEAHELKEARQARSMRGTKQHTTVEVDVETLTTRLLQVLQNRRDTGTASSSVVRNLMWNVTLVFLCFLAVVAYFLYFSITQDAQGNASLEKVVSGAALRTLPQRFVAGLHALGENTTADDGIKAEMAAVATLFSRHFEQVATGDAIATYSKHKEYFKQPLIPIYVPGTEVTEKGASLWNLGEIVLSSFRSFLETNDTSSQEAIFLQENIGSIGKAFNYSLALTEKELDATQTTDQLLLILFFGIGLLCIAAAYITFLVSFQRTALGRVFTFQLFTLIPYEALEKLSTQTKEKTMQLIEEKAAAQAALKEEQAAAAEVVETSPMAIGQNGVTSPQQPQSTPLQQQQAPLGPQPSGSNVASSASTLDTSRTKDDDATSDSSRHPSTTFQSASAPVLVLKSCFKKSGILKVAKTVKINPRIEYFGGTQEAKDKSAAKDEGAKGEEGAAEEEEKAAKQKPQKAKTVLSMTRKITTMIGTVIIVFLLIAAFVITIVHLVSIQQLDVLFDDMLDTATALAQRQESSLNQQKWVVQFTQVFDRHLVEDFFITTRTAKAGYTELARLQLTTNEVERLLVLFQLDESLNHVYLAVLNLASFSFGYNGEDFGELRSHIQTYDVGGIANQYVDETNETTMNNPTVPFGSREFAGLLARQILVYNTNRKKYEELISGYEDLAQDVLQRKEDDLKGVINNGYSEATIAIFVVAAILCIGLVFLDPATNSDGFITIRDLLMICLLCALGITGASLVVGAQSTLEEPLFARFQLVREVDKVTITIADSILACRRFVGSGRTSFWFQYKQQNLADYIRHFASMLINRPEFSVAMKDYLENVMENGQLVTYLHSIANALTMRALNGSIRIEKEMQDQFDATVWNFVKEPEYTRDIVMFKMNKYYTNNTYDFSLPPSEMLEIAQATLFGDRHEYYRNLVASDMAAAANVAISAADDTKVKESDSYRSVCIMNVAFAAVGLVGSFYLIGRLSFALIIALGLQASTSSSTLDTTLYAQLLSRCRWSLLFLAVLLCGTFGVSYWTTTIHAGQMKEMNIATLRDFFVAESISHLREAVANHSKFDSFYLVRESAVKLRTALQDLAFGKDRTDGKWNKAPLNPGFDSIVYGETNEDERVQIRKTYFTSMCSDYLRDRLPFVTRGPYGVLANPVQNNLFEWINALLEVEHIVKVLPLSERDATVSSTTALFQRLSEEDAEKIYSTIERLVGKEGNLLQALEISTSHLYETTKSNISTGATILQVIIGVLMASIVLVYVGVFFPTVQRLVEEEESARLLLRMIPVDVRDQVPAISEFIETGKIDNAAELQKKFEASEKLLQNILPQKIAARLKSGESPIADMHPSLTILFTDFVSFTKRSSTMQAAEIVDFLNEVFLDFDVIVDLLELEKIKTIGDAYFMAGGLDPRISDHAMRAVEAGLKMFEALTDYNERHPSTSPLCMRLGVHSGPAVAGVIGTKKVAYDLWGDSVEIANAMETTAIPGIVHISETTANQVEGFYCLEPRGELPREKESIPDVMPKTFLVMGRRLPTPYMHVQRPRLYRQRASGSGGSGVKGQHQTAVVNTEAATEEAKEN